MEDDYDGGIIQQQVQPSLMDQSQILKIIDTGEIIEIMKHGLKGEYLDDEGEWKSDEEGPLMNNRGINKYMMFLESLFNKNTGISNLKEEDYHRIIKKIKLQINKDLFVNHQKYDLDEDNIGWVRDIIVNPIELHLTIAMKDLQRKHIFGTKSMFSLQKLINPNRSKKGMDMYD